MPPVPPRHHNRPEPRGADLPALLKAWRARAGHTRASRSRKLTQVELAHKANISDRWYRKLESGEHIRTDPDALDRLAQALHLSGDERAALYLHTAQLIPLPPPEPDHDIAQDLRHLIDGLRPHPAFLTNRAWDILRYNQRTAQWFPWITHPSANLARWLLLNRDARIQIIPWEKAAAEFLAVLRFAYAHSHNDPHFTTLLSHILDDPTCRQLWERHTNVAQSLDNLRIDLRLPTYGFQTTSVTLHLLHPADHPTSRLAILAEHEAPD